MNRSFGQSPGWVLIWLIASVLGGAALTAVLFADHAHGVGRFVFAVVTVVGLGNLAVYGPRAYRAMKSQRPD